MDYKHAQLMHLQLFMSQIKGPWSALYLSNIVSSIFIIADSPLKLWAKCYNLFLSSLKWHAVLLIVWFHVTSTGRYPFYILAYWLTH